MNDVIAITDIRDLVGGTLKGIAEECSFIGIETELENIRGGELFINCALLGEDLQEAFERGCVAVLTKEVEGLPQDGAYLFVSDCDEALRKIAVWWRSRFSFPIVAVYDSAVTAALLARLLLKSARGAFIAADEADAKFAFKALCKLHGECEWGVCELQVGDQDTFEAWAPDFVVVSEEDAKNKTWPCTLITVSKEENKVSVITSAATQDKDYAIREIQSDPLLGCCFKLSLSEEKTLFLKSTLIGAWRVYEIAAGVVTALQLAPQLSEEQIVATVKRFSVLPGKLNLRLSCRGRIIIDGSLADNAKVVALASELKENTSVAFVMMDSGEGVVANDDSKKRSLLDQIVKLAPKEVVLVGEFPLASTIFKESGIQVLSAPSVKVAINVVNKLETEYVFITAAKGLSSLAEGVLLIEGESVPDTICSLPMEEGEEK